jgi:glutathione synthase/RimK-type ligase-like ATP-grasp enzyme
MKRVRLAPVAPGCAPATVRTGSLNARVACLVRADRDLIFLPTDFLDRLGLAPGDEVNLLSEEPVALGPLVGVLLGADPEPRLNGAMAGRYQNLAREAREMGALLCVFDAASVNVAAGQVKGWVEQGGQWERMTLPLPDVIYNRATYSDLEGSRRVRDLLERLQTHHGVALLNGVNAISKLQVYEALTFFGETEHLAPRTVPLSEAGALTGMLQSYDCLFAKADYGSHGSDVLKLSRSGGGWAVSGKAGGKPVNQVFPQVRQLQEFVNRLPDWIVQQGIPLPEVEGRVFDLRVIVQKDGAGRWDVALVVVRHAAAGSVAANVSQGGEGYPVDAFLARYGEQLRGYETMADVAVDTALRVAAALESRCGLLGEVGVDIGLDREGRPWVFEANTKPRHPPLPGLTESLTRRPLAYAIYLAERACRGRSTGSPRPRRL